MNNRICIFSILLVLLTIFAFQVDAQVLHEVVLTVDDNQPNSKTNQSFNVGNKTEVVKNTPGNRFTIWADVGDSLLWKAKAKGESKETVNVIGVEYVSGPRIFSSNNLTGKRTVRATIIRGGEKAYVYKLLYSIGSDAEVYSITAAVKTKI